MLKKNFQEIPVLKFFAVNLSMTLSVDSGAVIVQGCVMAYVAKGLNRTILKLRKNSIVLDFIRMSRDVRRPSKLATSR